MQAKAPTRAGQIERLFKKAVKGAKQSTAMMSMPSSSKDKGETTSVLPSKVQEYNGSTMQRTIKRADILRRFFITV